jgi:hypothetical protein
LQIIATILLLLDSLPPHSRASVLPGAQKSARARQTRARKSQEERLFCHPEPQAKDQREAIFQTDTLPSIYPPMHIAKVHELKDNPSEALRAAKKSPVIVMKATTPRP